MASDKKKGSGFDLDSVFAGYGLRIIKSVVRKGLPKLMALNKTLYLQLCVLFRTGDPADREIVEGSARVAVEVLDTIFDKLPFVPNAVKNMFDDFGGDLITEVRDHFAHVAVDIPDDLPKLEGDDALKNAGGELAKFLRNLLLAAGERLKGLAAFLTHLGIGVDERGDLIDLLFQLDELDDFMLWFNAQSDTIKSSVRKHAKLINDPAKYQAWKLLDNTDRAKFFQAADDFLKFEVPVPVKDAYEGLKGEFGKIAATAAAANLKLDPNYKDGPDWKVDFYSAPNLKKHEHRHETLPAGDERKVRYERKKNRNRLIRNVALVLAALLGWALMTGNAQKVCANIEAYLGWVVVVSTTIVIAVCGVVLAALVILWMVWIYKTRQHNRRATNGR